jgi:F420-dependent oxidoreductase-like protein
MREESLVLLSSLSSKKGFRMQQETRSTGTSPASMRERIGLSLVARDASDVIDQIIEAERAGLSQIWLSQGGSGGADSLTVVAMAAARTERIRLGTAIVPTYPRHPIVMAQQVLAINDVAPGRLRLGIGPSHRPIIEGSYGLSQTAPLAHLREYMTVLRCLLSEGNVEYSGRFFHVKAQSRIASIPLLISALGTKAFHLAGEISDGALSWVCPVPYLLNKALPALQAGAQEASRPAPPLVAHVVVALSTDEAAVQAQAQQFLRRYSQMPFYAHMFEEAGLPVSPDGSGLHALAKALVISGDEATVREQLIGLLNDGLDELMVHPLPGMHQGEARERLVQVLASIG